MIEATEGLQLILGPDKRNPSFCLYTDPAEKSLHVYYGLELLEVVPNERDSPAYRFLAARLYNAGLRVQTLEEVFGLDRKTMRRWGLALQSGDRQLLVDLLNGRWGRRKFTLEMEGYVRQRWPDLQRQGKRDYRKILCEELERVFGVKVAGETLRPLLAQLRAKDNTPNRPGPEQPPPGATVIALEFNPLHHPQTGPSAWPLRDHEYLGSTESVESPEATRSLGPEPSVAAALALSPASEPSSSVHGAEVASERVSAGSQLEESTCAAETPDASVLPISSKIPPPAQVWSVGQTAWCEHAGLWLFWPALAGVSTVVEPPARWLRQALANVLAGAVNVEQTKFLNGEDLELLLGPCVWGLGPQRQVLKHLAAGPTADAILGWNSQRVGAQSDLYLDPHTKHYTGMAEVLKGWCPTIRWADKALHSDFLHTAQGQPVYFECTDNFEDLRTRLWGVVQRARRVLGCPEDKTLTLVIDRAVFGQASFERIFQEPKLRLITWQKGYREGDWAEDKVRGQCVLERARNHAADVRSYHFRYLEQRWEADPRWRQLIVRATPPSGRTLEVGILTDDWERPAVSIIRLMFWRWVQENDFKYLDQHFGINQITSYGTVEYEQLKGQLTDRQVQSGAYRAVVEQAQQVRAQLGRLLFAQHQAEQRQVARQARQVELEKAAAVAPAPAGSESTAQSLPAPNRRELGRLKAAQKREDKSRAARQQKIQGLEQQLQAQTTEQAQTQQSMSRLDDLIARGMVRLDTGPKRLLDAIKVVARNEFYRALKPFRVAYDNYRDDHEHFRRLSQSAGVLRWNGRELEVHLMPRTEYGPALQRIWTKVLEGVNAAEPVWPDGSGRRVRFYCGSRRQLQVSLRPL